ncbi:hypothetical protein N9A72_00535 [bacterium]|nr:hypothetical protein [bacterium]
MRKTVGLVLVGVMVVVLAGSSMAMGKKVEVGEEQSYEQVESTGSQKIEGSIKKEGENESKKWFREYIRGIGEYLATPDLSSEFNGDIYANALRELKDNINLSEKEIELVREITVLETERTQLGKELWYIETLPGRMSEAIRAEQWTPEDEKKRENDVKQRKTKIEKIEMYQKQKIQNLRTFLKKSDKENEFQKWIKEKRQEYFQRLRKNKELNRKKK